MTKPETIAERLANLAGLAVGVFLMSCLRGWLLSLCAAIFFPTFTLSFWEWVLIAYTFRFLAMPTYPLRSDD